MYIYISLSTEELPFTLGDFNPSFKYQQKFIYFIFSIMLGFPRDKRVLLKYFSTTVLKSDNH